MRASSLKGWPDMSSAILIGSDHAGFQLKEQLKAYLEQQGIAVLDVGAYSEESCDYPLIAHELCTRLLKGEATRGILICGTGLGMSITANRHPGVRAALCTCEYHARMSRAHNDSNVLVFGGRVTASDLAISILRVWLDTPFEGGRHARRVEHIEKREYV